MQSRVKLKVKGRVQGVFFRQSTLEQARLLCICGWVANERDGSVSIEAQGQPERLESFINWCKKGPPSAVVDKLEIDWQKEADQNLSEFRIIR